MDAEENEAISSIQKAISPSVVVNTSQTSWGRRLDMPARQPPPLEESQGTSDGPEPAKKKHRSDVGPDIATDADRQHESGLSKTTTTLKQSSLTNYIAATNLRSRLASFAMPGSQPSVSSLPTLVSDEDVGVEATDGTNEEVDELEDDTQPMEEEGIDVDDVDNLQTARESSPDDAQTRDTMSAQPDVQNASNLPIGGDDDESDDPSSMLSQARATSSATPSTISKKSRFIHPEIIKTNTPGADITLRIDIERMKRVWSKEGDVAVAPEVRIDRMDTVPPDAGLSNADDDEKAVSALARVIDKLDFDSMEVIGQFNLGFIIVRRRKGSDNQMDDLFIVDQHAADEKYNFEMLQETTKIESQKLFRYVQIRHGTCTHAHRN
jgi:DNA mismatch repair protein PMS2